VPPPCGRKWAPQVSGKGGSEKSNLLVVLCGERAAQPVVNTGTIYQ
jgi:hypothetical protein